jgi:hypothetical protein
VAVQCSALDPEKGLKIRRPQGRGGSSPPPDTMKTKELNRIGHSVSEWPFCCGGCSDGCWLFLLLADQFHGRQLVFGRKMRVPGAHGDCFVTGQFLNVFDGRALHGQP